MRALSLKCVVGWTPNASRAEPGLSKIPEASILSESESESELVSADGIDS